MSEDDVIRATRSADVVDLATAGGPITEDALALRFAVEQADRLRYVAPWKKWLFWNGAVWREDKTLDVFDRVRRLLRALADRLPDERKRDLGLLGSAATVAAVERLARSDRRLAATVEQWNADPLILCTPAGIVDLQTGSLRPARPEDYCSKCTAVAPAPAGTPVPRWRGFLDRITDLDETLDLYLQRAAGYSLSGDVTEEVFIFAYGYGQNGKGVLLHTLAGIAGDYAQAAPAETFLWTAHDRHPTELADLHGARLVVVGEIERGRRWAESRLKMLTGRDPIRVRRMREDPWEFRPECKLWIAGNHKPSLRGVDKGWRRRLQLVPFLVTIGDDEKDPELEDKLREEWPAILRWAIDGHLAWRDRRLDPPRAVTSATEDYLLDSDVIRRWADEDCERVDTWKDRRELFRRWREWCDRNGERPGKAAKFYESLSKQSDLRETKVNGYLGFRGLKPRRLEP